MSQQIAPPFYMQIKTAPRRTSAVAIREHRSPTAREDETLPLVLLTLHPGYAAGSYDKRDYFELLVPYLFHACHDFCRLRVFTINHPGYDMPVSFKIHRFRLEPFSLQHQPAMIDQVLRWLVTRQYAVEDPLYLVTYGHSMGGLALAQCDLQTLTTQEKRRIHTRKVLSAPALALSAAAKKNMGWLRLFNTLRRTFGMVPLYEQVAKGLFLTFSPILYRRDAENYSLNPDCSFLDFRRYNPFLLLQQGRELLDLDFNMEEMAAFLNDSHLILATEDGMVDNPALYQAADFAGHNGASISVSAVPAPHNLERETPALVADELVAIILSMLPVHP